MAAQADADGEKDTGQTGARVAPAGSNRNGAVIMTDTRRHLHTLKRGITPSPEFKKKELASFAINVGIKCGHDCLYCSTGALAYGPYHGQEHPGPEADRVLQAGRVAGQDGRAPGGSRRL